MATASHAVDEAPTALTGLANGTRYAIQNVGNRNVQIAEAASAPDAGDHALFLEPGEHWNRDLLPEAGLGIWVWCLNGESVVVTSEAE
ncbi:MAG: hypothetical protein F4112_16180 [Holophagales bacterium]|nr:hypothetical protein [Holophagales bacterium]MYB20822.1 hypothetical protein [Holophagales bacterium]MYD23446.1 hypothetical protein [Holophagales bacterium]MYH25460.1 hypothetical protein [Holophagales bacterium]MYI34487.1 hypothetical protein [Holophagales bacterium]